MYTSAACIFNNVPDTLNITSHRPFFLKKKNITYSLVSQRSAFVPSLITCFACNSYMTAQYFI